MDVGLATTLCGKPETAMGTRRLRWRLKWIQRWRSRQKVRERG
jgi:hypothetical protein